jgi:hypothetical protein
MGDPAGRREAALTTCDAGKGFFKGVAGYLNYLKINFDIWFILHWNKERVRETERDRER